MSKAPPSDLAGLLRYYHEQKLSRAINIFFQADGDVQVSVERGRTMSFFGEIGKDPVETLIKALTIKTNAPVEQPPKPAAKKPPVVDDDDDDMSVI